MLKTWLEMFTDMSICLFAGNFILYVLKYVASLVLSNTGDLDEPSNAGMNDIEPDDIESFEEDSCHHNTVELLSMTIIINTTIGAVIAITVV